MTLRFKLCSWQYYGPIKKYDKEGRQRLLGKLNGHNFYFYPSMKANIYILST